jgi:hypothetical protein
MKKAIITVAATTVILTSGCFAIKTYHHATPTPVVEYNSVVRALNSETQIVGLSGKIEKRVRSVDSKWYGDRTYDLTVRGDFKLGVDTKDIEVSTKGNTVTVRFPHAKVISADVPYDKAIINENVGVMRKDFTTAEAQAIFGKARKDAVKEVGKDTVLAESAEVSIGKALRKLIEQVPNVDEVNVEVSE